MAPINMIFINTGLITSFSFFGILDLSLKVDSSFLLLPSRIRNKAAPSHMWGFEMRARGARTVRVNNLSIFLRQSLACSTIGRVMVCLICHTIFLPSSAHYTQKRENPAARSACRFDIYSDTGAIFVFSYIIKDSGGNDNNPLIPPNC